MIWSSNVYASRKEPFPSFAIHLIPSLSNDIFLSVKIFCMLFSIIELGINLKLNC